MSISLGGVTLNPDMIWREQFVLQSVAQSTRRTLGGSPVVFAGSIPKGHAITLAAAEANGTLIGVLRKSVVDSILVLAAVAGSQHTFTYNGTNYTVIFRHEDGAVDMVPLVAKVSYSDNDLMRGEIRLLTV